MTWQGIARRSVMSLGVEKSSHGMADIEAHVKVVMVKKRSMVKAEK